MAESSGLPTIVESSPNDKMRATKRKLDDAFHVLDGAVNRSDTSVGPSAPKKRNTMKTLYSTLAKYGIKNKETSSISTNTDLVKKTPHLSAILSRAASKTKSSFSFRFSTHSSSPAPALPSSAEYRPSSLPSFLSRLETYKLATYANKPAAIDAVAASKCGWINDGKDRLVCGLCNASWAVAGREGLNRDAANALVEKQRASLVEAHKNGCPWKTRQCDDSIYCIPLQAPGAMIRELKTRAVAIEPKVKDILIKHPLSTTQLNALRSTVASYDPPDLSTNDSMNTDADTDRENHQEPSETSLLTALFGWSLVPAGAPLSLRRASTMMSASNPPSPSISRASSVSHPRTPPRQMTPMASISSNASISTHIRAASKMSHDVHFRIPNTLANKAENALLQCELCQRRIGLWAFTKNPATENDDAPSSSPVAETPNRNGVPSTPSRARKQTQQRSFDLLKEHRSYCPYTVRSTVVPSLPLPPQGSTIPAASSRSSLYLFNGSSSSIPHSSSRTSLDRSTGPTPGTLEGWRAVLTVILRYGMAEKKRIEYSFLAQNGSGDDNGVGGRDEDAMEIDPVKAMVSGVKARGGKDLLSYVKGLLG